MPRPCLAHASPIPRLFLAYSSPIPRRPLDSLPNSNSNGPPLPDPSPHRGPLASLPPWSRAPPDRRTPLNERRFKQPRIPRTFFKVLSYYRPRNHYLEFLAFRTSSSSSLLFFPYSPLPPLTPTRALIPD
jgi:hypothetical protein